jgi:hypothetical protein
MELVPLNLPSYPFKVVEKEGKYFIFDNIRKKELVLSPEEWVRQHFVQYLINSYGVSKNHISLEKGLKLNDRQKRSDILVYNDLGNAILLIECKAPSVKITQDVFDQVARYNMVYKVKYLAVTNGLEHYFCEIDHECQSYKFIEELIFN